MRLDIVRILVLPQVDYMVLVVSSVEVDVTRVDDHEWKQDEEDLNGVFASVYKVAVEQIGLLQGRHAILWHRHVGETQEVWRSQGKFRQENVTSFGWSTRQQDWSLVNRWKNVPLLGIHSFKWVAVKDCRRWGSDLVEDQQQVFQLAVQIACNEEDRSTQIILLTGCVLTPTTKRL